MAKLNFECKNCKKEFDVSFMLFRPAKISCPHCKSDNISEKKSIQSCGCGSKSGQDKGFRFT